MRAASPAQAREAGRADRANGAGTNRPGASRGSCLSHSCDQAAVGGAPAPDRRAREALLVSVASFLRCESVSSGILRALYSLGHVRGVNFCLPLRPSSLHELRTHGAAAEKSPAFARRAVCCTPDMRIDAAFNELTGNVIGAAIEVHRHLGPGLLESTYLPCFQFELSVRHLRFTAQRLVPIVYKGLSLGGTYRIDLVVEDLIVVETKSVDRLLPVHEAQLLTYLRLSNSPAGLLINFNVPKLTDGVKRLLNASCVAGAGPRSGPC